jgi:SAM-dependent methyltransferase
MLRPWVRSCFAGLQALPLMDRLHFQLSAARYRIGNRRFRRQQPGFTLPPDRLLHETYRLDYAAYAGDGRDTANELLDRCRSHLPDVPWDILEWGCGVGRITRHLPGLPEVRSVTGADINADMIRWNRENLPGIDFRQIGQEPPTPFPTGAFHLIIGISVLTHVPGDGQSAWLDELHRILHPDGVLLLTTQGKAFKRKLTTAEQRMLERDGVLTRDYPVRGHRMMSTFHDPAHFRLTLSQRFGVVAFRDGDSDPQAAGGQDLWLLRKSVEPSCMASTENENGSEGTGLSVPSDPL